MLHTSDYISRVLKPAASPTLLSLIVSIFYLSPVTLPAQERSYYLEVSGQEQEETTTISQEQGPSPCVEYNSENKVITVTCSNASLTDIDNQLKDPEILHKESNDGVWLLNADIVIDEDAKLSIDARDTRWLKIKAGEGDAIKGERGEKNAAHSISVLGSLVIDSVKVTSWVPSIDDYMKYEVEIRQGSTSQKTTPYDRDPRPYIRIESDATGYTSISNSEIAYIGYDCGGGCSGLSYYGGLGHIIENNEIHHNRFGYYSSGVSNTTIQNNYVHHNFMYGFDPHTGTNNMIIRNNTLHDHGAMGIICSLDCYNITIEDNEVYRSTGSGIMFSKNMIDSVARNNYVHDESKCIFVSQSHRNEISNNKVSNCNSGIRIFHDSSDNTVQNNTIANSEVGLSIEDVETNNQIYDNKIINTAETVEIEEAEYTLEDIAEDNEIMGVEPMKVGK